MSNFLIERLGELTPQRRRELDFEFLLVTGHTVTAKVREVNTDSLLVRTSTGLVGVLFVPHIVAVYFDGEGR